VPVVKLNIVNLFFILFLSCFVVSSATPNQVAAQSACLDIHNCGQPESSESANLNYSRQLIWDIEDVLSEGGCIGGRCPGETKQQCQNHCHDTSDEMEENCSQIYSDFFWI
jgi:hypothetical protein